MPETGTLKIEGASKLQNRSFLLHHDKCNFQTDKSDWGKQIKYIFSLCKEMDF